MGRCALALAAALAASPVAADDACGRFAWSVERERTAFAADPPVVASGGTLPAGARAAVLVLAQASGAALPLASGRAAEPGGFGGYLRIPPLASAGTYQVTLSAEGWIEVGQAGDSPLRPVAHSGQRGCPSVRKSVRYVLDAGPATVQVSGAASERVRIAVEKAD